MTLAQALALNGVLFMLLCALAAYLWRDFTQRVEKRLDELEASWKASSPAVMELRVKRLEGDYFLLHEWKRLIFPQETERLGKGFYEHLDRIERWFKEKVDRLERKVFNGHQ